MSGRRTYDDKEWKDCCKKIDSRDKKACQFERCLSAKEAYLVVKGSPTKKDRAHIFSAGNHPEQVYNVKNVVTLQRFIHVRMDTYKNPITEETISYNENRYWWYRIKNHLIEDYDENVDYELLLLKEIRGY